MQHPAHGVRQARTRATLCLACLHLFHNSTRHPLNESVLRSVADRSALLIDASAQLRHPLVDSTHGGTDATRAYSRFALQRFLCNGILCLCAALRRFPCFFHQFTHIQRVLCGQRSARLPFVCLFRSPRLLQVCVFCVRRLYPVFFCFARGQARSQIVRSHAHGTRVCAVVVTVLGVRSERAHAVDGQEIPNVLFRFLTRKLL